jgi:hypothetical protein
MGGSGGDPSAVILTADLMPIEYGTKWLQAKFLPIK